MLLTLSTTHSPATDLGYLLHKHPAKVQNFGLGFGQAYVLYPQANNARCVAALLLDMSAVPLVRRENSMGIEQHVNDRLYGASSFLSVAIAQVYGSALNGKCKERLELVDTSIPLEACIAGLPAQGGEKLLRELFEPLGYSLDVERYPLDTAFPGWGESRYCRLTLRQTIRLSELLGHLYVLIPVLDNDKHYFVAEDEVEKLLRRGEGWLANHPAKMLITQRYLKNQRNLMQSALTRLVADEAPDIDDATAKKDAEEAIVEEKIDLHTQRLGMAATTNWSHCFHNWGMQSIPKSCGHTTGRASRCLRGRSGGSWTQDSAVVDAGDGYSSGRKRLLRSRQS
jgi:3' terminal RNA ribose 2'-O-methyltransferase Hen1